ncbi:MAG: hypothetical protein JWO38_2549 [Gemmataceae bacterium]|nr:hypothetical protein [Gemmataceae bacterium]
MADNAKTNVNKGGAEASPGTARPGGDAFNRGTSGGPGQGQGGTVDTLRDTAQSVADKAGEYAHQAREAIGDWSGQTGEKVQRWAGEAYDVAADQVGDFGREVSNLVRRHPIPALLIGFGVGMLLGRAARAV